MFDDIINPYLKEKTVLLRVTLLTLITYTIPTVNNANTIRADVEKRVREKRSRAVCILLELRQVNKLLRRG